MRYPRVFYTECNILKEYNPVDSQLQYVMMKPANDDKFITCTFIDCFPAAGGEEYLAVLQQYIVFIDMVKRRVIWELPIAEFDITNIARKNLLLIKRTKHNTFFSVSCSLFRAIPSRFQWRRRRTGRTSSIWCKG